MFANAFKRGGLIKAATRGEAERQEPQWTIAEMKAIILREREIRQQAQLAAEQEAKKVILQLEEELDTKDQQLQQERASRKKAELTAQELSKLVVANDTSVATTRDKRENSQITKMGQCPDYKTKHEAVDEDVAAVAVLQSKRPLEATKSQLLPVSKKRRGPNAATNEETSQEGNCKKMTLAEARKAAREEVEKRTKDRANEIEAKKKK